MSEQPSWMTEENASTVINNPVAQKAAKSAASNPEVQKAVMGAAVVHVTGDSGKDVESQQRQPSSAEGDCSRMDIPDETLAEMKKWHMGMRIAMVCTTVAMAAAAVLTIQKGATMAATFISIYVFFFAILLFCFEFGLRVVSKLIAANFGFMYSGGGRLLFMVIVAGMCARLDILGQICIGLIGAIQLVYLFVLFRFPKYEEYLRKKHYYAEKDFQ
jgi:hypothetical protein